SVGPRTTSILTSVSTHQWSQPGSNRRPPRCTHGALPAELWPLRPDCRRSLVKFQPPVSFEGSYMWRLRRKVGHDLVLQPGAAVAAQREDGKVLFIRRGDNGVWALPGGAAEEGGSFAR